ncbi:MAG: SHOCT domain-containing protein, partial [Chloroflexi bacterium]|nr:SHOCT domain-containing protein [Chloroflexota bacterium]
FGAIAMVYGSRLGGIWGAVPLLAWTALFATLGWNFLDYGLFNPPPEADGIVWGWLIPGVVFEVMAFAPLVLAVIGWRETRRAGLNVHLGPAGTVASRAIPGSGRPVRDTTDTPWAHATVGMVEGMAEPVLGPAPEEAPEEGTGFAEGSQALLDRLERLGDMRDRGLLTVEEFETAKGPIVAELESRS